MEHEMEHDDLAYIEAVEQADIEISPAHAILHDAETRIGRDHRWSTITVREKNRQRGPIVSSRHAAIKRVNDDYMLIDLESTNGTFVDGVRIPNEPYVLNKAAMLISLGSWRPQYAIRFVNPTKTIRSIEPWLTYQPGQHRFFLLDHEIHVTGDQYRVLCHMHEHHGALCTREQIATILWGPNFDGNQLRSVDQFMNKLRERFADALIRIEDNEMARKLNDHIAANKFAHKFNGRKKSQEELRKELRKEFIVTRRSLGYELHLIPRTAQQER
jgi:hypothetical protein